MPAKEDKGDAVRTIEGGILLLNSSNSNVAHCECLPRKTKVMQYEP